MPFLDYFKCFCCKSVPAAPNVPAEIPKRKVKVIVIVPQLNFKDIPVEVEIPAAPLQKTRQLRRY